MKLGMIYLVKKIFFYDNVYLIIIYVEFDLQIFTELQNIIPKSCHITE